MTADQPAHTPISTESLTMSAAYRMTFDSHYKYILQDMVRDAGGNILPTINTDNNLNFTNVPDELVEKIAQATGIVEFHRI